MTRVTGVADRWCEKFSESMSLRDGGTLEFGLETTGQDLSCINVLSILSFIIIIIISLNRGYVSLRLKVPQVFDFMRCAYGK